MSPDEPEATGTGHPWRAVARAALHRVRPLPFPEGQVREPRQRWLLLLGSWMLQDLGYNVIKL